MCQIYHSNASTNQHVREIIQKSDLANVELANMFSINVQTVSKWKGRDFTEDKSSRPNTIIHAVYISFSHYGVCYVQTEIVSLLLIYCYDFLFERM